MIKRKLLPTGGNFFNINPASGKPDAELSKLLQEKITPKLEGDTEISVLKAWRIRYDCTLNSFELPHLEFIKVSFVLNQGK